jgi:hypothetical protein
MNIYVYINIMAATVQEPTEMFLALLFRPFGYIAPKTLIYLGFYSYDFERS